MLLHDGSKSEDAIHSFFKEAYELYVKVRFTHVYIHYTLPLDGPPFCCSVNMFSHTPTIHPSIRQLIMNPFFEFDKPIVSPAFDARIRQLEKRYLR